jgi:tellurite resistance protein TehA-like permease
VKEKKAESGRIAGAAANLFPGYFALVMATGIISIATYLLDMRPLAWVMLAINLVAYVVLWLLLLIRLIRFFPRIKADITDHARGPGFFTVVAGTCVLGSQLVIVAGQYRSAGALWVLELLLWVLIMPLDSVITESPTVVLGVVLPAHFVTLFGVPDP